MKKIYSLVLLVAGVFSWGSCSLDEVNPNNSGQFSDGSYTLETYKAFTNSCLIHWKLIRHSPTRAIQL